MSLKMNGIPFTGQFKVKKKPSSIIENPNVYGSSRDYTVKKLDSDGNEIWHFDQFSSVVARVAVDPGHYPVFWQ